MTDIYRSSLQAKYDSVMRIVSLDLGLGDDLALLPESSLVRVHNAADQAILDWASRRSNSLVPLRPISNLQHLLDEYCAIAEHL